jgi:hypothetical protein
MRRSGVRSSSAPPRIRLKTTHYILRCSALFCIRKQVLAHLVYQIRANRQRPRHDPVSSGLRSGAHVCSASFDGGGGGILGLFGSWSMYSSEGRIRAVKLYLRLESVLPRRFGNLAIRQRNRLNWYHAYERCLELPRVRICLSRAIRQNKRRRSQTTR